MNGFPLAERAGFGGHAELRPGAAATFAATAGGVQRGGVPLIAGTAGGFSGDEDFGRGGGEAGSGEACCGVAEAGEHLGAAGEELRSGQCFYFFRHGKKNSSGSTNGSPASTMTLKDGKAWPFIKMSPATEQFFSGGQHPSSCPIES